MELKDMHQGLVKDISKVRGGKGWIEFVERIEGAKRGNDLTGRTNVRVQRRRKSVDDL